MKSGLHFDVWRKSISDVVRAKHTARNVATYEKRAKFSKNGGKKMASQRFADYVDDDDMDDGAVAARPAEDFHSRRRLDFSNIGGTTGWLVSKKYTNVITLQSTRACSTAAWKTASCCRLAAV